jgi:hypothetical protein
MLITGYSIDNLLRWTRRWIVIILILLNLMAVIWADSAGAVRKQQIATMIQYSSTQAGIDDIAAGFINPEAK